jgi:uncharacterized protein YbaR (Trm112 family)
MRFELLEILRCPEDFTMLTVASTALIDDVNAAIREERLVNRAGKQIRDVINEGLVRAAGDVLYPIVDEIPVMLRDEAIELKQLGHHVA